MNQNVLNSAVRTLLTIKMDTTQCNYFLQSIGVYSNMDDCFVLTEQCIKKYLSKFRVPNTKSSIELDGVTYYGGDEIEIYPMLGCKFTGINRDKGSVTSIVERPYLFCAYLNTKNGKEADNLVEALSQMGIQAERKSAKIVRAVADVIANPSTDRDNVVSLLTNSLLEYDCMCTGKELELTVEEVLKLDITKLIKKRDMSCRITLENADTGEVIMELGKHPVMIEDFFYQPQHSNFLHCREKAVSLNYHQAKDGLEVLTPTLYKKVIDSANLVSIKEDMLILGLEIGTETDFRAMYQDKSLQEIVESEDDEERMM